MPLKYYGDGGNAAPLSKGQTRAWVWKKDTESAEAKEPLKPAWRGEHPVLRWRRQRRGIGNFLEKRGKNIAANIQVKAFLPAWEPTAWLVSPTPARPPTPPAPHTMEGVLELNN